MKFQMIGDDGPGVEIATTAMGLKREEGLDAISDIAAIKTAWAACRKYQQAEDQNRADTKVLGLIAPMKATEFTNIRLAYERANTALEDHRLLGQSILDAMEASLEEGEYRAPRLIELPSKKEVVAASHGKTGMAGFTMSLNMQGGVRINQPVKVKLTPPADGCEFRDRIRLLQVAHEFVKIRHPLNAALKTSSKEVWEAHIDHILGDKIKGKELSGIDGKARRTAAWELVMHYEGKVREKAAKLMSESHRMGGEKYDLASALKAARENKELLEDDFLGKSGFKIQQYGRAIKPVVPKIANIHHLRPRARSQGPPRTTATTKAAARAKAGGQEKGLKQTTG